MLAYTQINSITPMRHQSDNLFNSARYRRFRIHMYKNLVFKHLVQQSANA